MKIKNANDLKKMVTDETVVDMVANCLVTQAYHEFVKEKVDAYKKPIFDSYEFFVADHCRDRECRGVDPKTGRILEEESLFLTDLEGETYLQYNRDVRQAHLDHEFAAIVLEYEEAHNGDQGWCPALIAETEWRKAKRNLADHVAKKWLEVESIHYPQSDKLVDLVIKACVNGPCGESLKDNKFSLV